MGMGLSISVTDARWPEETKKVLCNQCGSGLLLTRWRRWPGIPVPGGETEQYCPQCGAPACKEISGFTGWIKSHKVLSVLIGTGVAGGLYGISRRN